MKILQPYLAIDIETTGLDITKAQVLEVGLVYDDGISSIKDLKKARFIFKPENDYYEFYAMSMHSELLKEIAKGDTVVLKDALYWFVEEELQLSKVTFAGKNISGFDLPILKNNNFKLPKYSHRMIDVGSMYFHKFGYVPSLQEINTLIGYKEVSHTALEDTLNIVIAIRALMDMNNE